MKPTSIACVVIALFTCGFASAAPTGLERTNMDLHQLWTSEVVPEVRTRARDELNQFLGQSFGGRRLSAEIRRVRRVDLDLDRPFGFLRMDDRQIALRLPVQGNWNIRVDTDVKVRLRVGFLRATRNVRLTTRIEDLHAEGRLDIDSSDPDRPRLTQVQQPQVDFRLRFSTNKWYLNLVLRFLRGRMDRAARQVVTDALDGVQRDLLPLVQASSAPPPGLGGPPVAAGPAPALPLETAARAIDDAIQADHLPHGSLVDTQFETPYHGTWEDSLTDPTYTPGTVRLHRNLNDSSIWSGHYLVACAYRFAVTGDVAARDRAEGIIDTFHTMLTMRGVPGLLNRAVYPAPAVPGQAGGDHTVSHQGVDYQAWDFISRDQYMGVLFGMSAAHELIPDQVIRDKARRNVELALDYILANGWSTYRRDGSISMTYVHNSTQQLAWLNLGNRVNPGKYGATLTEYGGLAELVWVGAWFGTLSPIKEYYKFNLSHGSLYTLLRLEQDPARFMDESRALRILRAALGHHQNAHFDVLQAGMNSSLAPTVQGDLEHLLRAWLRRPRRHVATTLSADPTIEQTTYTPPHAYAGIGTRPTETIARYPVPIERRPAGDFLWQKHPFKLDRGGNGTTQFPGVDFLLPYWMGRYHALLP